jgi:hypothetical protein
MNVARMKLLDFVRWKPQPHEAEQLFVPGPLARKQYGSDRMHSGSISRIPGPLAVLRVNQPHFGSISRIPGQSDRAAF